MADRVEACIRRRLFKSAVGLLQSNGEFDVNGFRHLNMVDARKLPGKPEEVLEEIGNLAQKAKSSGILDSVMKMVEN